MTEQKHWDFQVPEGWAVDRVKPISPQILRIFLREIEPPNRNLDVVTLGDR